jgi:hypothetical protein
MGGPNRPRQLRNFICLICEAFIGIRTGILIVVGPSKRGHGGLSCGGVGQHLVVRWLFVDLLQVVLVGGWLFVAVGQVLVRDLGFFVSRVGVAGEDYRLVVGQSCIVVIVVIGVIVIVIVIVAVFAFEKFRNRLCGGFLAQVGVVRVAEALIEHFPLGRWGGVGGYRGFAGFLDPNNVLVDVLE